MAWGQGPGLGEGRALAGPWQGLLEVVRATRLPLGPNLQYAWQLALSGLDGDVYWVMAPLRAPALPTAHLSIIIGRCGGVQSGGVW